MRYLAHAAGVAGLLLILGGSWAWKIAGLYLALYALAWIRLTRTPVEPRRRRPGRRT